MAPLSLSPAGEAEFFRLMIKVAALGLLAFGVSGGLLWAFFQSLQREHAENERRLTTRSAVLLALVIASLLVFSLVFVLAAY